MRTGNMELSEWTQKDSKTKTDIEGCYTNLCKTKFKGERSTERRSTRPENVAHENSMRRPKISTRPGKK